ncbi:hypothetical protein BH23PLA1_BH23PLA1_27500 [soil metagenome]
MDRHFDFGTTLSRGQELRHEFTLINPTDRSIRLLKAESLMPCCSAVGPFPETIRPDDSVELPVLFRPGSLSGRKGVRFVVWTDDPDHPVWELSVSADLVPEVRIEVVEGDDGPLALGISGSRTLRITCLRIGQEGRGPPEAVSASSPLSARFSGPPIERSLPGNRVESSLEILLDLPAAAEPGHQTGLLLFRWADGQTWEHQVSWQVTAPIQASPAGLILSSPDPTRREVHLSSSDRPFRVLGVEGLLLARPPDPVPDEARRSHAIRLSFDPSASTADAAFDVIIRTDHPHQPTVTLSVLVTNGTGGDGQ